MFGECWEQKGSCNFFLPFSNLVLCSLGREFLFAQQRLLCLNTASIWWVWWQKGIWGSRKERECVLLFSCNQRSHFQMSVASVYKLCFCVCVWPQLWILPNLSHDHVDLFPLYSLCTLLLSICTQNSIFHIFVEMKNSHRQPTIFISTWVCDVVPNFPILIAKSLLVQHSASSSFVGHLRFNFSAIHYMFPLLPKKNTSHPLQSRQMKNDSHGQLK